MKQIITIILLVFSTTTFAQSLTGRLIDKADGSPLVGANIYWQNSTTGTFTNNDGTFEIPFVPERNELIINYIGYENDTLSIAEGENNLLFEMGADEGSTFSEVVISTQRTGTYTTNDPTKIEVITEGELAKAACCDLAGCFETQASVQPVTTNAVTNAKELRILGLSGVYNQLLFDGLPMIQGLGYTYGVSSYPGTLVNRIYIAKGANSILQGFEGMSGQINVIPKQPQNTDGILLNAFANSNGVHQLNANYTHKSEQGWTSFTSAHISRPGFRRDVNDDNFLDFPLVERQAIYHKIQTKSVTEGLFSEVGLRYWHETRTGGEKNFDKKIHKGSSEVYGQHIAISQPEIYTKTGYILSDKQQVKFIGAAFFHQQNSYFGIIPYTGLQQFAYANLQYEHEYGDEGEHNVKAGLSYRHSNIKETIDEAAMLQQNRIPGFFVENISNFEKFKLITGMRWDVHQEFGGFMTSRFGLNYNIAENTELRFAAGTGWRTASVYAENPSLLASSREVIFEEELRPEQSANLGVNIVHKEFWTNLVATFTADYYYTQFSNQIFPDYDRAPGQAILANFTDPSASNTFQAEANLKYLEQYEFKFAYNFLNVFREIDGKKTALPFNSKHRLLTTFSYQPLSKKWHFDTNIHWSGRQRLPDTNGYPERYQQDDYSQSFTLVNAQYTYKLGESIDLYGGCENIFNFRQADPILAADDPFGTYFDTAFNWGPTIGREIYVGVRYRLR